MRSRSQCFLARLLLAVAFGTTVAAQAAAEPAAVAGVDAALAAYELVRDGDDAARTPSLSQLAGFEDARVTAILLAELQRAGVGPFAARVLQWLGQRPRGDVLPPLRRVLERADAPPFVQRAAATAIGKQGHLGIDLLIDLARDGDRPALRLICFDGLAAAGDDRAFRGLAALALAGPVTEQQHALRCLAPARQVAAATQARVKLLQSQDPVVAAMAWRQLAAEGDDHARHGFDELRERLPKKLPGPVGAELVYGLAAIMSREFRAPFVELAADSAGAVREALRRVAVELGQDAGFVGWLIAEVLDSPDPGARDVAMAVLRCAPAASVQPVLDRVRKDLRATRGNGLDLAVGLHDLLAKDPAWKTDLQALLDGGDAATRTAALAMLLELDCGDAVAAAQQYLGHKSWELRSIAYRYLTRFRDLTSIPLLIARADKEHGRLDAELAEALFVHTGTRCWRQSEWEAWWRKHKQEHVLPHPDSVRNAGNTSPRGGGATVAYYGIPMVSRRAAFLIDVSGSMSAKIGTDQKRTRLDEAKRQLRTVVEKMPEDYQFNVISYETGVAPTWDVLRQALARNKEEALGLIAKLQPRGGTNIFDALELAFRDPEVDTIYLLTDGQPSAGRVTDVEDLADQVQRWNYSRQVVVHGISVGLDSKLLRRLAKESGGQYVFVR